MGTEIEIAGNAKDVNIDADKEVTDSFFEYGLTPLSYSKINTLYKCPLMFKLRYVDKQKGEEAPKQADTNVGTFIHKVLEYSLLKASSFGYTMEIIDFDLIWHTLSKQLGLTHQEYNQAQEQRIHTERVLERIIGMINRYGLTVKPESKFTLDRNLQVKNNTVYRDTLFIGYVDFLGVTNSNCIILDYKTFRYKEDSEEDVKRQLAIYQYIAFKKFQNIKGVQVGVCYTPDEYIKLQNMTSRDSFTEIHNDFIEYLKKFKNEFDRLSKEGFSPVPGKMCDWCVYYKKCPAHNTK